MSSIFYFIGNVFFPVTHEVKAVEKVELKTHPTLFKNLHKHQEFGFTKEELADRLAVVFKTTGKVDAFAKLIFIIGHNSTTTNNPYQTAYGCGACCGRNGGVNARFFAQAANDSEVRILLKNKYNILIPENSVFVGGLHDTSKDSISLYNTSKLKLDSDQKELLDTFENLASVCLKENAVLRCVDFANADKDISPNDALEHVHKRAMSFFQPRPELGHTRNALTIVGKRNSTRNLSFERRAFLQSYDWSIDPDGKLLEGILSAAIPVTGGINLDYLFSKMNNRGVGAGSKLAHNIIGLVGLSNGTEDDLLTGLAYQMIELHEPIRTI